MNISWDICGIYVDFKFCFGIVKMTRNYRAHRADRPMCGALQSRGGLEVDANACDSAYIASHRRARAGCQSGRVLSMSSLHLASRLVLSSRCFVFARATIQSGSLSRRVDSRNPFVLANVINKVILEQGI